MKIINITNSRKLLVLLLHCIFFSFFTFCEDENIVKDIFIEIDYKNNEEYRKNALDLSYRIALNRYLNWVTLQTKEEISLVISDIKPKDYVSGYSIESEKFKKNKYSALITVNFDKEKIEQLLSSKSINYFLRKGPKTLLIPLVNFEERLILWDDPNPWFEAWIRRPLDSNLTDFILPTGEVDDLIILNAEEAKSLKYYKIKNLTFKYGAKEALVLIVNLNKNKDLLEFNLQVYDGLKQEMISLEEFNVLPKNNLNDSLFYLANSFADYYDDLWVKKNIEKIDLKANLRFEISYQSFNEWINIKNFFLKNSTITDFSISNLSNSKAFIKANIISEDLFIEELKKNNFSVYKKEDTLIINTKRN